MMNSQCHVKLTNSVWLGHGPFSHFFLLPPPTPENLIQINNTKSVFKWSEREKLTINHFDPNVDFCIY